jgi:hypothetical protein
MKNIFLGGTGLKSSKEACKLSLIDNTVKENTLKLDIEQLGGFFFLKADSLEEAKAIVGWPFSCVSKSKVIKYLSLHLSMYL